MMAESAKEPFDSPDFIFEIKLDGYRAITVFDDGRLNRPPGSVAALERIEEGSRTSELLERLKSVLTGIRRMDNGRN